MSESRWRDISTPIIRRVLADMASAPLKEKRRALQQAYPFGPRQYHPYRIWCDEIARQLGTKPPLGTFGPRAKEKAEPDPRQEGLFE